jgi:hypothetical protein
MLLFTNSRAEPYFFNDTPEAHRIEAQPIDGMTGQLRGSRQVLFEFGTSSFTWFDQAGLAITRRGLIFSATEFKGNIWLKRLPEPR